MQTPFLLGVNYWPRRKAMYWWSDFDAAEVDADFALIRDLGISIVRIFLLWDDFQPEPDQVSPDALHHLGTVFDLAAAHQLKLDVTFFTGHMSGPNWAPRWLLDPSEPLSERQVVSRRQLVDGRYRNFFTDPVALDAERLLLRTVVGTFKDHPALWMWNLGNEPDLFAVPPDPATGTEWVRQMRDVIRAVDDQHPVTCGLHFASLTSNNNLRVDQVFAASDMAVMHAYPMYVSWARNPLDPEFMAYVCALTRALAGKPVLMEEFGGCTALPGEASHIWEWLRLGQPHRQYMASEQDLANYLSATLTRLVEVGTLGAIVWCFADYAPELWDKPPCSEYQHERYFGLVRPDGSLKPHAEVIRAFAATHPTVQPPDTSFTLDVSADEFYQNPAAHAQRLYNAFLAASVSR